MRQMRTIQINVENHKHVQDQEIMIVHIILITHVGMEDNKESLNTFFFLEKKSIFAIIFTVF